ncbi:MAG TPA: hypothetical protein VJ837_03760 [Candidatus Paceibacterota bacterium]|nr:hypothetical protein [Candidatus Paceibacterota bacterium]
MKSSRYALFLFIIVGASLLSPALLSASDPIDEPPPIPKIDNPIKYDDADKLLIATAEEAAKVGFYVIVGFLVLSGFFFVSAHGNKTKLEAAHKTFFYTVVGAAILLGAVVFANVIKGTVDQLGSVDVISRTTIV